MILGSAVAAAVVEGTAIGAAARKASPAAGSSVAKLRKKLGARMLMRGNPDYESMRQLAVFNARKPNRFPNAIVMAETVEDVQNAIRYAKARGWKVGVRSGGHSWVASHTRDGALLISLANLRELRVEPDTMTAIISPSITGDGLNGVLQEQHKLMTPSAHGVSVGMGGFVMCGGHGWNSRVWGPGCQQLKAIDVVDADGNLIHATAEQNSDWLWAARGAGPGYFGAAVRYYLQVHPMPQVMRRSGYTFDLDHLEEVVAFLRDNTPEFPAHLEVVMLGRVIDGKPGLFVGASGFGTDDEVKNALDAFDAAPIFRKAKSNKLQQPFQAPSRYESPTESLPAGYRIAIDNVWTNAPSETLVPLMRDLFRNLPGERFNIFFQCWGPVREIPNAAYSVQGEIYISANAVYMDEADDAKNDGWALDAIRKLHPISVGAQMNDENMALDPQRYLSDEAAQRLEMLRTKYDPERRFVSFLKRA
jgi:FAD/FMN-containing dehydrogenase